MFLMEERCTVMEEPVEDLKQEVDNKVCPSPDSGDNASDILPACLHYSKSKDPKMCYKKPRFLC
jgi:hypothetical protein